MTHSPRTYFGNWSSPISSELVIKASIPISEPILLGSSLWWLERRPDQNGRTDIMHHHNGTTRSSLPQQFSCRSRVHEYGGGSYCVSPGGLYFVNDKDQNIYFLDKDNDNHTRCITTSENTRYADLTLDFTRQRLICVQEYHAEGTSPVNSLIAIDLVTFEIETLTQGHDFYTSPRVSPDAGQIAWLCWNHPRMPWDAAELWLADLDANGAIETPRHIAGGKSVSAFQPEWSPTGELHYIDDSTGWWNIYRYRDGSKQSLFDSEMEFGLPQWVFAQSSYAFISNRQILCSYFDNGRNRLGILDCEQKSIVNMLPECSNFSYIHANKKQACLIAASDTAAEQLLTINLSSNAVQSARKSADLGVDPGYFSQPHLIEFQTRHHDTSYANYYPPHNPETNSDPEQKPPLIVITHGGPNAHSDTAFDIRKQFWTSRGFALLDVNYSGSTGYGREYRDRLYGQWGIRDAEDCCDAALHMVNAGLVDPDRLIIKGSSAGGYTVLCALTFHDTFSAGASYYGIGELETLARHTHKFEAHYLDQLIGPYPEMRETYQQRSPLNHVNQLSCPVIFFQGLDDKVVPAEQSEMMFNALKQKGIATSYLTFPDESHGFRKPETIITCLKAELEFYARVFGLPLDVECDGSLVIENLAIS